MKSKKCGGRTRERWAAFALTALWIIASCAPALADTHPPPQAPAAQLRGWDETAGYQYVHFGRYEQDFWGPEPVLWRVLAVQNGKALLFSEKILDTRPIGPETKKEREKREKEEREAAEAAGAPEPAFADAYEAWDQSVMKVWLEGVFLPAAFSRDEQTALPEGGALGRVFLLSRGELTEAAYGFSAFSDEKDPARAAVGTRHAKDSGLDVQPGGGSPYYTRTKDSKTTYTQVRAAGAFGSARYDRDNVGVRPAVWVDLEQLCIDGGDGTQDRPYDLQKSSGPRVFDGSDILLCNGKSILDCRGPDVYAAFGAPLSRIYLGMWEADSSNAVVWDYGDLRVDFCARDGAPSQRQTDLSVLPYDDPSLEVQEAEVKRPGVPGPRGIQVGMPMDEVLALFPATAGFDAVSVIGSAAYRVLYQYQDEFTGGSQSLFSPYPPYGVLYGPGQYYGEHEDWVLVCNYIDPQYYAGAVSENGAGADGYDGFIYSPQYILVVFFRDGMVSKYTLYHGATAE